MTGSPREAMPAGVAEAVGTCLLVLVSAGAACFDHAHGAPLGRAGVAVVSGLTLGAAMSLLGRRSVAYLNPAATLAALVAKRLSLRLGVTYVFAQLAGAAAGGVLLRVLFPAEVNDIHLGAPALTRGASALGAAALEAVIAFAWVIMLVKTQWRTTHARLAPWTLALVFGGGVLAVGPLGGAAGDPLRAFGPAFASGVYADQEVYWLGPLTGALAAAVLYRRRRSGEDPSRDGRPADAMSHYRQGTALMRDERLAEAAHQFALATELSPAWPEPYYYIGIIYRELGDEASAARFFEAAVFLRLQNATSRA